MICLIMGCTNMINEPLDRHPLDKSEVRKLTLDNGVKAYLLSNPDFNVSAASMVVEVGSLENPGIVKDLLIF